MSVNPDSKDLPEGWVLKLSRGHGIPYYFDTKTGQSSWKKPTTVTLPNKTKNKSLSKEKANNVDFQAKEKDSSFVNKMKGEIKKYRETYSKMSQIRKKSVEQKQKEVQEKFKKFYEQKAIKKMNKKTVQRAHESSKKVQIIEKKTIPETNTEINKKIGKPKPKMISNKETEKISREIKTVNKLNNVKKEVTHKNPKKSPDKHKPEQRELIVIRSKRKRRKNKLKNEDINMSEKSHSIKSNKGKQKSSQCKKNIQTIATLNKLNTQCAKERIKSALPCLEIKKNWNISITKSLSKRPFSHSSVSSSTLASASSADVEFISETSLVTINTRRKIVREDVDSEDVWMEGIEVTDPGDVNQIIEDIHMESQERFQPVYVVLDTNVLITSWTFLRQITKTNSKEFPYVCFIVPWVVIQELDGLKQSQRSSTLRVDVMNAIKYVNQAIREKHRMIGQSIKDVSLYDGCNVNNNDDNILKCCLQYQEKVKTGSVSLCTNDINLQTKALISGVNAFAQKRFTIEIKKLQPTSLGSPDHMQLPIDFPVENNGTVQSLQPIENESHIACKFEVQSLQEIETEMKAVLKSALSLALEMEMKDIYEEQWLDIVIVKPPWSFRDIMVCYDKHWIAVFGMFLPRPIKSIVTSLLQYAKSSIHSRVQNPESLKLLISKAITLCQSQVSHFKSRIPEIPHAINTLQSLRKQCDNLINKLKSDTNDKNKSVVNEVKQEALVTSTVPENGTSNHIAQVFDTVWHVILQISVLVFDSLGFPHQLVCEGIEGMTRPSVTQALQWLYSSGEMLQNIVEAFHRVLATSRVSKHDSSKLLEKLTHLLVETKATLDFKIDEDDFQQFCCVESNRTILTNGVVQLQNILAMLEQCAVACSSHPPMH
ncbi:transcriptional protein SWT1-like isoform X2 [Antedon mediterranea]